MAGDSDALMFVDAPLVVRNEKGQRPCETQVGQRYGRWKVSANTTNVRFPRLAGVRFLNLAGLSRWRYSDGRDGPPRGGRFMSETYPYATLVGAAELGYDIERPRYKRKPPRLPAAQWRTERVASCDTVIRRLGQLADADPPLLLQSHPVTGNWPNSHRRSATPPISTERTSLTLCSVPGPHRSNDDRPSPTRAAPTPVIWIRAIRGS